MRFPVRKSAEGVVITTGGIRWVLGLLTLLGTLIVGAAGAVRFFDKTRDAPSREEFVQHVRTDSVIHASQSVHDAFQDSLLSQSNRTNHELTCFVWKNPQPFCDDLPRRRP